MFIFSQGRKTINYETSRSDTLQAIALKFSMSTSEVMRLNNMRSSSVFPGQVRFCRSTFYQSATSLLFIFSTFCLVVRRLYALERIYFFLPCSDILMSVGLASRRTPSAEFAPHRPRVPILR